MSQLVAVDSNKPINLGSREFTDHKYEYYKFFRQHHRVVDAKIAVVKVKAVSRYEDCLALTKDPRFGRDKAAITGDSPLPFPVPKSVALLAQSMIVTDDPEHRRLRSIVQKAFAPKNLKCIEGRVTEIAHKLLDAAEGKDSFNLQSEYALQIPSTVIAEMVGVSEEDMPQLQHSLRVLSDGLSGWSILRTFFWDLRKATAYMRTLIAKKRLNPGDDILTGLIEAEEDGRRLSEDEVVSMLFLLIVAGFETTVHLITNGVVTLLGHQGELQKLQDDPALMGSAVEEILRYLPPVQGTKMNFAREDLEFAGARIKKGEALIPLLGCANRDERVFDEPDVFNIRRDPNKHLSFSQGNHFCLGAFLARMETKIALDVLLQRAPDLRLAQAESSLRLQNVPLWHRFDGVQVSI